VVIDQMELAKWLTMILHERFGTQFVVSLGSEFASLRLPNVHGEVLIRRDSRLFFDFDPKLPCTHWSPELEGWESLLGASLPAPGADCLERPLIVANSDSHTLTYDVLALTTWMLNRAEEVQSQTLDSHGRFPITASHGHRHSYVDRPIVDEWLHVLGQVIQRQWPSLPLRQHTFEYALSHDVDRPFMYRFMTSRLITRFLAGDLLKRRNWTLATERWNTWRAVQRGNLNADPYNTFDWLMTNSETHQCRSVFYFICGGSNHHYDADYSISHSEIRKLLRDIHERGHEIGLHPSYDAFDKPTQLIREANRLREICRQEGISQTGYGARMHYLRWRNPETASAIEQAGLAHDASLGYPEMPSFRCGTCHEYPMYDLQQNRILSIRIRPLVFMDSTVFLPDSGSGESSYALTKLKQVFERCQRARGKFSVLWHNSSLSEPNQRNSYLELFTWRNLTL
jgi:hypothetical protein